jgi:eukaryotic-like serine/threonine-protein kinase
MNTIRICPSCRAPLPANAPAGLCPACLLQSEAAPLSSASPGPPTDDSLRRPRPGEEFGGYRILRLLGQGGMGEVYEAGHLATGRRVALKVMNRAMASEQDRKRFLREGRLAAGVSHPNVVYIYGSEEISGSPVIAMELVSSGTLQDRVKRGPLPSPEAVDATLQLIAGLEAAEGTGVLHRDIKPANCFIGDDGVVKVGDFGLSISTIARGETLLTAHGSVLGTPAYASPEQLRGEDLGVASDIYSVGATLYHLLTGRLPFESPDFVRLITEVLDKVPPSPDKLRPEINSGLAKVVMRCLAKDRAARFPSYAALRKALLPFSSAAPSPAVLGLRFIAGTIDEFMAYTPSFALLLWTGRDAIEKLAAERNLVTAAIAISFLLWDLLYYAIPEGFWSASIGKAICGLRVVGPNRGPAGLTRALVRSLIFRVTWSIPVLATLLFYTGASYQAQANAAHWNPEDWLWFPLLALLFCTMRRRNGFAGLHELASGTRVIARPSAEQRPRLVAAPQLIATPSAEANVGPYEILGSLGSTDIGELLLAHDPALRRNLWIHRVPAGTPAVPVRRRDLSRATRLRWLNGRRDGQTAWDAYEALEGAPLPVLPPQGWQTARFWLHDLAAEYASGSKHDSLPPALGLDRVWITSENRAVLLDFPAPGINECNGEQLAPSDAAGFASAQRFLHAVAEHALRPLKPNGTPHPLPLHAQPFLRSLGEGRFESPEIMVGNLQSLLSKLAEVSRRRRLAVIGLAAAPALLLALAVGATLWFSNKRTNRDWPSHFPESAELRAELRGYEAFRDHPAAESSGLGAGPETDDPMKRFRRAFRIHFAGHHRELIADASFWAHPAVAEALTSDLRRVAEESITDYPDVNPNRLEEADATIQLLRPAILAADQMVPQWAAFGSFWALLIFSALLDLGCVLLLGEGLFLRMLGIAAVKRDGYKASRLRLLSRTLLVWSPCALGAMLSLALWLSWMPGLETGGPETMAALGVLSVVVLALVAFTVWKPTRGPADFMAGTWLVTR